MTRFYVKLNNSPVVWGRCQSADMAHRIAAGAISYKKTGSCAGVLEQDCSYRYSSNWSGEPGCMCYPVE